MDCEVAREALSARIDGEREPVPAARVDEHLAGCGECASWYARAVEQTQQLRRLAGRSQVAAVAAPVDRRPSPTSGRIRLPAPMWRRWTLAAVGAAQLAVAAAQALGANVGTAAGGHHAMMGGHLLNESTAWSAALGVVMVVAAARPAAAAGLAGVLSVFTVVLTGYVVSDALSGAVSPDRVLSHLPVLAGTVLALLVWRDASAGGPEPRSITRSDTLPDPLPDTDELVLPQSASRGRRRGHLYPTDGSAA